MSNIKNTFSDRCLFYLLEISRGTRILSSNARTRTIALNEHIRLFASVTLAKYGRSLSEVRELYRFLPERFDFYNVDHQFTTQDTWWPPTERHWSSDLRQRVFTSGEFRGGIAFRAESCSTRSRNSVAIASPTRPVNADFN